MTDAEKNMKKYVTAVERRLNLPRDVKARVMADFGSSIQARREAGQTDAQIYEELGSPKKAAADLNEQMKEFAYRKSPWRFFFGALAAYGGLKLLSGLWVNLIYLWVQLRSSNLVGMSETSTIGIIGGADGPTAIFVSAQVGGSYGFWLLVLGLGVWGFYRLSRCRRKGQV